MTEFILWVILGGFVTIYLHNTEEYAQAREPERILFELFAWPWFLVKRLISKP